MNESNASRVEPRGLQLLDLFGLITGISFAAPVFLYPVAAQFVFVDDPAEWRVAIEVVWACTLAFSWGAVCALWARDVQYDRLLRPGEWLLILHAAVLVQFACWVLQDAVQPNSGADDLSWAIFLVAWGVLFVARIHGARARLWLRVPSWLLVAAMLWLPLLFLMGGETFYYGAPADVSDRWPVVLWNKIPAANEWAWAGFLLGMPFALAWRDHAQPRVSRMRWTECTGLVVAAFDLTMGLIRKTWSIVDEGRAWPTELIWIVPTIAIIVVGSWLGAFVWRRWIPYCPTEQRPA